MQRLLRTISIALLLITVNATAQTTDQWIAWGDAAMERGEFYGASRFYKGALKSDPGRLMLQFKMAEACRLSNRYDEAAALYARVYQKDQGRTYGDALRWLAEMQMSSGDHEEAKKSWRKLIQRDRKKDSFNVQRAENAIKGCELVLAWKDSTTSIVVEHLPGPVNTNDSEFAPRIGPDNDLYFSSLRSELTDDGEVKDTSAYRAAIYRSAPTNGSWAGPEQLPFPINGEGDNANITWSTDSSRIYFTRCLPSSPCRIYVIDANDPQATPGPLPGLGEAMSTQPQIVRWEEREMLLFVSDREGSVGGTDIWQAEIKGDSAVSVHRLNGAVNSIGNERTPFFDPIDNALHFSSDFHPGIGGYDIFTSAWKNDEFAQPENAIELNNPANDLYPNIDPDREFLWFASNRIGSFAVKGETCCSDIYRIPLEQEPITIEEDTATIAQADTSSIKADQARTKLASIEDRFPVVLYFHNDIPDPRSWATRTDRTYEETFQLYRSMLPEYFNAHEDSIAIDRFFHDHVEEGRRILIELIDALLPALENGDSITIAVRGFASPLAKSDYNNNLSLRRINSLENELHSANNGALSTFIQSGALKIERLPFGEEKAQSDVSDDLHDTRRSVYSVGAMKERRIEIEAMEVIAAAPIAEEVHLIEKAGTLRQDEERMIEFEVKNLSDRPLRLIDMKADCGCTTTELPDAPIPPGGSVPIGVHFNGRAPLGPISRTITLFTDGLPRTYRLTFEGEMVH